MMNCLACGGDQLVKVIKLGKQPPANLLLVHSDDPYPQYTLQLNRCKTCGHGQLSHSVDPKELFLNYRYSSGVSQTMRDYFAWFAEGIARTLDPTRHKILEIACNDGSLMREIAQYGFEIMGVEPDPYLAQVAREKTGQKVINQFWPIQVNLMPFYDVVIALNVLAHTPDPLRFLCAIRETLGEGGLALIQVSQGDMLRQSSFDTIYHEHLSYFTKHSMEILAERAGLVVQRALRVDILSGSDLYILRRPKEIPISRLSGLGELPYFQGFVSDPPEDMESLYNKFAQDARLAIRAIGDEILWAKQLGRPVAFVGAAAKASVVLHSIRVFPHTVHDESHLKIGRYIPNTGLRIQSFDDLAGIEGDLLCVVSAWNCLEEIRDKVHQVRQGKPTEYYTYFPYAKRSRLH